MSLEDLTASCVHCGFCLPACPTYALSGDENESPRGRIHLARQVITGQAPLDADVAGHIDSCLGCLACVPACPSGVRYDRIIEEFRPEVEAAGTADRGRGDGGFRRLLFALFPHPGRLRIAAAAAVLYRRTGGRALVHRSGLLRRFPRMAAMEALLPVTSVRAVWSRIPRRTAAQGDERHSFGLITGCVQRVFFADVNEATVRVLTAEGCAVIAPKQGCCGALSLHAGREGEAKSYARAMIDAFGTRIEDCDAVVVNVAGCGSTLKSYGELLADDPAYAGRAEAFAAKVRDVSEVLAEMEPRAPRHPLPGPDVRWDSAQPTGSGFTRPAAPGPRLARLAESAPTHPAEPDPRSSRLAESAPTEPVEPESAAKPEPAPPIRLVYHDACHLSHGQGVRAQPRQILATIPGLELVEPAEPGFCCGSAGIHNLVRPDAAADLGRRKADRILAAGPDLVATGNPGCLLQIQRYLDERSAEQGTERVRVRHPVELLDASIRGTRL